MGRAPKHSTCRASPISSANKSRLPPMEPIGQLRRGCLSLALLALAGLSSCQCNQSSAPVDTGVDSSSKDVASALVPATNLNETTTSTTGELEELRLPTYLRILATLSCLVIFSVGVCGNLLVPLVVVKTKYLRNSTNLFLINLSIADLLVLLVCMPTVFIELHSRPETWLLGESMCKLTNFVEMLATNGSIFTILAISFERYYAICKPLKASYKCTRLRATIIIGIIWLLSSILTAPILIMAKSSQTVFIDGSLVYNCILETDSYFGRLYVFVSFVAFFCLPLLVLMLVYWLIGRRLTRENLAMKSLPPPQPPTQQQLHAPVQLACPQSKLHHRQQDANGHTADSDVMEPALAQYGRLRRFSIAADSRRLSRSVRSLSMRKVASVKSISHRLLGSLGPQQHQNGQHDNETTPAAGRAPASAVHSGSKPATKVDLGDEQVQRGQPTNGRLQGGQLRLITTRFEQPNGRCELVALDRRNPSMNQAGSSGALGLLKNLLNRLRSPSSNPSPSPSPSPSHQQQHHITPLAAASNDSAYDSTESANGASSELAASSGESTLSAGSSIGIEIDDRDGVRNGCGGAKTVSDDLGLAGAQLPSKTINFRPLNGRYGPPAGNDDDHETLCDSQVSFLTESNGADGHQRHAKGWKQRRRHQKSRQRSPKQVPISSQTAATTCAGPSDEPAANCRLLAGDHEPVGCQDGRPIREPSAGGGGFSLAFSFKSWSRRFSVSQSSTSNDTASSVCLSSGIHSSGQTDQQQAALHQQPMAEHQTRPPKPIIRQHSQALGATTPNAARRTRPAGGHQSSRCKVAHFSDEPLECRPAMFGKAAALIVAGQTDTDTETTTAAANTESGRGPSADMSSSPSSSSSSSGSASASSSVTASPSQLDTTTAAACNSSLGGDSPLVSATPSPELAFLIDNSSAASQAALASKTGAPLETTQHDDHHHHHHHQQQQQATRDEQSDNFDAGGLISTSGPASEIVGAKRRDSAASGRLISALATSRKASCSALGHYRDSRLAGKRASTVLPFGKALSRRSGSQPVVCSHFETNGNQQHFQNELLVVRDLSAKKQQMDSRRQVVVMLAFVVACFFLLFVPYRVFTIWLILSTEDQVQSLGMETYYNLTYFSRILIYLHSAINPIAYNLISTKFRSAFTAILLCRSSSSSAAARKYQPADYKHHYQQAATTTRNGNKMQPLRHNNYANHQFGC